MIDPLDISSITPEHSTGMYVVAISLIQSPGALFVLAALVVFYLAGRFATDALTIGGRTPTSLRIAIGHFIPVALVALCGALSGNAHVAVGVVFATAVGAMSLNLGTAASSATHIEPAPPTARAWAFLLPASVMTLMVGFGAQLTAVHAILLLVQGLFVVLVWTSRRETAEGAAEYPDPRIPLPGSRKVQLMFAIGLSVLAGWIGVNTANRLSAETGIMSPGLIAAVVLSPLLLLPMIGTSSSLAQQGHARTSIEASVVLALLNLCLLLPACIAAWYARPMLEPYIARVLDPTIAEYASATQPTTLPASEVIFMPMPYPLVVWRLDTVVLIVLSLLLLPVALGRWTLGRREGFGLIAAYTIYLVFSMKFGARW